MKQNTSAAKTRHWPVHLFLVIFTLLASYPILWVLAVAFSGTQSMSFVDLQEAPGFLDRLRAVLPVPANFSVQNFVEVMRDQPFGKWLLNSLIVSSLTAILGITIACSTAYAFSRFRFPGRKSGMTMFLVSQMFPGTLMMIPLYIIVVRILGMGNSYIGLVAVYGVTSIPFCVWMLKGYFDTIPIELEESALIDGASRGRIFISIILPLARPAVAVTALFSFLAAWNEFILAAIFLEEELSYTAPVGLRFFVSEFSSSWGYFAAGSVIVSVPVVVLFMFLQKNLVSGLMAGSVKG